MVEVSLLSIIALALSCFAFGLALATSIAIHCMHKLCQRINDRIINPKAFESPDRTGGM